jgi:hypothetical protein
MSRYNLKPNKEHENKEIAVGFDRSTGNFFVQIYQDGEIIKANEGSNGYVLSVMDETCDRDDLLTETVFNLIMMDIDPAQSLGLCDSWEDFTKQSTNRENND